MNLPQTTSEQADKRYIYRYYSRPLLIISLFVYGIATLVFAWLAITNKQVWVWLGVLVFFMAFLVYGWIALLDSQNKFVIVISQTGIYLPIIWKRESTMYLPFSSIRAIELIKLRRETMLKLSAGKEIRVISEACFPQRQDFKELIGILQKRSSIPFSGGSL